MFTLSATTSAEALDKNPYARGLKIFLSISDEDGCVPASSQVIIFQKKGSRFEGNFFMYIIAAWDKKSEIVYFLYGRGMCTHFLRGLPFPLGELCFEPFYIQVFVMRPNTRCAFPYCF